MSDINHLIITGRIVADPTSGSTPKGTAYSSFSVAINEFVASEKKTNFVDIRAFASVANFVSQYLTKGRRILIEGRIRQDSWQDKSTGAKRTKTYIIASSIQALDSPSQAPTQAQAPQLADADYPF